MLLQTPHPLKTEMVWQGPDGYSYADPVLFPTHSVVFLYREREQCFSWCPKSSLPEVVFYALRRTAYGHALDLHLHLEHLRLGWRRVPFKAMCSRKCAVPLVPASSKRLPHRPRRRRSHGGHPCGDRVDLRDDAEA
jgi:hypothetical protein